MRSAAGWSLRWQPIFDWLRTTPSLLSPKSRSARSLAGRVRSDLPALIGVARAKQMIFTGARIKADLAERWGLVNQVVPRDQLMTRARDMANQIAANAPLAVQFAKTIVDAGAGKGLDIALEGMAAALGATTHDGKEGPAAFREKRSPRFTGK